MAPEIGEELLTYRQVEQVFNIPLATLYSAVSRRKIPHVRLGPRWVRFRRSDLEAWVDACSVAPSEARGTRGGRGGGR